MAKSSNVNIVVSEGSTGAKRDMNVVHVEGLRATLVLQNQQDKIVYVSAALKGDHIRFVSGSSESRPFNIAGTVADNEVERTYTLFDAEGVQIGSPEVVAIGGGSFGFTEAPAESYILVG